MTRDEFAAACSNEAAQAPPPIQPPIRLAGPQKMWTINLNALLPGSWDAPGPMLTRRQDFLAERFVTKQKIDERIYRELKTLRVTKGDQLLIHDDGHLQLYGVVTQSLGGAMSWRQRRPPKASNPSPPLLDPWPLVDEADEAISAVFRTLLDFGALMV